MSESENNKSSWLSLNIKVDLNSCLTRQVLFEKYSKKEVIRYFFMSKINECKLFKHKDYSDSIFYSKLGEILMEQDLKNKIFHIKYKDFWSVFSSKFGLNYIETKEFTDGMLKEILKLQDFNFTITLQNNQREIRLEDTLKLQDYTTSHGGNSIFDIGLEDTLKLQDFTTRDFSLMQGRLEETLIK